MACHFNDNVYTTVFTPREYQVELLDTAKESNTIVCLGNNNAKIFLAVKLLQELASEVRKCRGKRSLFLLDAQNVEIMSSHIKNLTDLSVKQYDNIENVTEFTSDQWKNEIFEHEVLVMTSDICMLCMHSGNLTLKDINLLAIDDCRLALKQSSLRQLFREYSTLTEENRPRILGLTTTILCKNFDPARLEAEFEYMEKLLFCNVDTSSDIVMVLRYCSKPNEKLLVCNNSVPCTLSERIVMYITNAKTFLSDHRYDPFEIYEEEFHEELQEVPDPKLEPNCIFDEFLEILYTMGPWCADRAAFALLIKIENLKVKTPYERHYLLLCMVSTVMVNVRALCDQEFETLSDNESIYAYSTPRVLRLLQVLRTFKPDTVKKPTDTSITVSPVTVTESTVSPVTVTESTLSSVAVTETTLSSVTVTESTVSPVTVTETTVSPVTVTETTVSPVTVTETTVSPVTVTETTVSSVTVTETTLSSVTVTEPRVSSVTVTESTVSPVTVTESTVSPVTVTESTLSSVAVTETTLSSVTVTEPRVSPVTVTETTVSPVAVTEPTVSSVTVTEPRLSSVTVSETTLSSVAVTESTVSPVTVTESTVSPVTVTEPTVSPVTVTESTVSPVTVTESTASPVTVTELPSECSAQSDKTISCTLITNSCDNSENPDSKCVNNVEQCTIIDNAFSETNTDVSTAVSIAESPVISANSISDTVSDTVSATTTATSAPSTAAVRSWKGRMARGHRKGGQNIRRPNYFTEPDSLCAVVFVEKRFTAKILYYLINELCHCHEDFAFLSVQYTVEKIADPTSDNREAEIEHRKQEEVLKKFRMHECNLLIATSVLEEGIDVPKCNLVIRFDQPSTYNSYVQCKGRAKMPEAYYILLSEEDKLNSLIRQLAQYKEIEKMLLKKCKNREPTEAEEREADLYTGFIQPYSPNNSPTSATVNVATAVALVNKYCAKLPSDTFTRLTPLWSMQKTLVDGTLMYICSIRLPINSPLKQTIIGAQMPNRVLARRVAALQVCKLLHQIGELDDNLLPVGKESFRAFEEDWNNFPLEESDELLTKNNLEPRPGTTKRRQYYYKKVADTLTDCRPLASVPVFLYLITMTLTCPLPEEQNTRGRKIYPPEDSAQGFGILTLKQIPKICPFPIFTRSGEVQVGLELALSKIIMTTEQLEKIMEFLNYIFTNVLRLQKYLMLFDPNASENSYFIVPTYTNETGVTDIDWNFLNEIYENRDLTPHTVPEEERKDFKFNAEMYQDAVVMPWYRNQDQPQYFYVAEICNHLNPKSSFPGIDYKTFEEYYYKKYDIQIQNLEQPLLDVDHTSARLNFLTPRYVNRKGVALPTSSEETKRAKRENLEQKQILVPELCTVHPFPASLWRKAVCLPCILYRINALLLADQIRKQVAEELALGQVDLPADFNWPPLNFGWSLSDVLKKSKENRSEKTVEKRAESPEKQRPEPVEIEETPKIIELTEDSDSSDEKKPSLDEDDEKNWMEIGTWSNEMATCDVSVNGESLMEELPDNITMCGNKNAWNGDKMGTIRYGSPTSWMQSSYFDDYDSDDSTESYSSEPDSSVTSNKSSGLRIEFKSDNVAEAIDVESGNVNRALMIMASDQSILTDCDITEVEVAIDKHMEDYAEAVEENIEHIKENGIIIPTDVEFAIEKKSEDVKPTDEQYKTMIKSSLNLSVINFDCEPVNTVGKENSIQPVLSNVVENDPDFEEINFNFSFDFQPDLNNHPGPSPSVILQALTMSNANDGINLERLETIGDSFLKYAITNYLYSTYDNIHEGKLSHLRSKQVSNLNLYRLGRLKVLGESMIATKFDPHDNWLPPCYYVPKELEQALIDARVPASHWNRADMPSVRDMSKDEICQMVREKGEKLGVIKRPDDFVESEYKPVEIFNLESLPCFIPYNLITQHSIPDKSVADCVEALIGAYLIECGPRGALLFMAWLGIRVLPKIEVTTAQPDRTTGSLQSTETADGYRQVLYGELTCPRSPFLYHCANPELELEKLLDGYDEFERKIQYRFRDRSYLLQALTHASYSPNTVTDCYQRLEFLGDAVLDYLITRHLYEDPRLHSPGALTDLRSALVNNTIFASLAVRHGFHKYFRHLSPGLHDVVNRFVQIQEENGHSISEEYYLITEDESEEIEDVEVPKALGDVFESVAGAIFLDSGMSLDAVWRVYYRMMRNEIEQFSTSVPKSPIRELLELEPETAKFGKPEKLADGRRVRVTVEVFGKGTFKGIGRNYRIAKCTAAKCALKQLKKRGFLIRKN